MQINPFLKKIPDKQVFGNKKSAHFRGKPHFCRGLILFLKKVVDRVLDSR